MARPSDISLWSVRNKYYCVANNILFQSHGKKKINYVFQSLRIQKKKTKERMKKDLLLNQPDDSLASF